MCRTECICPPTDRALPPPLLRRMRSHRSRFELETQSQAYSCNPSSNNPRVQELPPQLLVPTGPYHLRFQLRTQPTVYPENFLWLSPPLLVPMGAHHPRS